MWKDVSRQWKTVFEEAWEAFCNNSVPAGSAVYNKEGVLLAKDHNRYGEPDVLNRFIAHADVNVLNKLDMRNVSDRSELVLYSSLEPCHMCLGMVYLTGIKTIRSAARDLYMGTSHFIYEDAFLRTKQIDYKNEGGDEEMFSLVLQSYFEVKQVAARKDTAALECYRRTNETAVEIAEKLYLRRILDQYAVQGKSCGEVYDIIMDLI